MDKTNWGQLTQLQDGLRMMEERRDSAIPPNSPMAMVGVVRVPHQSGNLIIQ